MANSRSGAERTESTSHQHTKRLKGALIGYGFIGSSGHVPAYALRSRHKGDVDIVAVADICEARRAMVRQLLPKARVYATHEELLAAEHRRLDFIDIATPPSDHAEIAHAALNAGLHVLCEKPLTTRLEDAAALLAHARAAGRVLFPCHNYKHAPVVRAIREIIASGSIGRVRSVSLNTFRHTHARGVTEWNTHWRREHRYSGGGIAMDHGSHTFYLTFDWMGTHPTAVSAKMTNLDAARYDTEDNCSVVLTFPNGVAQANLTWTAGVRKVSYAVQGERGAITVDDDDLQLAVMRTDSSGVTWDVERRAISSRWVDASHTTWFDSLFDRFVDAIRLGDYVGSEALDAYRCIEIITTAYRSAQEQCRELPLRGPIFVQGLKPLYAGS